MQRTNAGYQIDITAVKLDNHFVMKIVRMLKNSFELYKNELYRIEGKPSSKVEPKKIKDNIHRRTLKVLKGVNFFNVNELNFSEYLKKILPMQIKFPIFKFFGADLLDFNPLQCMLIAFKLS